MSQGPPIIPAEGDSSADGARSATPEGERHEGRHFPCEGCGADLQFHIGAQTLKCPYCGFIKELNLDPESDVAEQDFAAMVERMRALRDGDRQDEQGFREIRCDDCGATVRFTGTLTSSECGYCGVPLQLDNVHDAPHRVPVDGVLPFLVKNDQARANLHAWVKSRWFAPNEFKKRGAQGRFNGLYTPYWTFDSLTFTRYSGLRGEHYWVTVGSGKNKRRVRRTRWYPASGAFQRFFDDTVIVAGSGLPVHRLEALEPWPLQRCVPFNLKLLAGFLARTYDVPLDEGFVSARQRMAEAIEMEVRQRIGGDTQQVHSVDTRHDAVTYKHLLLPVWMLAYRFREKAYQVVVNASTGEVQGDRPYSWVKISLTVLAALAGAAAIAFIASRS